MPTEDTTPFNRNCRPDTWSAADGPVLAGCGGMDAGTIANVIVSHGYPAIALIIGLESMGLPLPGETALITAALYAGSTHTLEIGPIVAAAAAGAIAGDTAGFWLGRWVGDSLILRHGSRLHLTPQRLA